MSDVVAEYLGLGQTFGSDGWRLLRSEYARAEVAMLNSAFPDRSKPVACEVLHAHAQEMLAALRARGDVRVPAGDGATVYRARWMNDLRLIEKTQLVDGSTQYRLRSSAIAALDAVVRLGSRDVVLSGSRVETIAQEIDKLAALVSGDSAERRSMLEARLEAAERALRELDADGAREPTPAEVEERLINIVDLLDQVPRDMRQIEEELKAECEELIDEFRADELPHGMIVGDYLKRSDELFNSTESGKVYNGALEMFAADGFDAGMHRKVRKISRSPYLVLSDVKDRYDIAAAWDVVSEGMRGISSARAACSRTIANAVGSYDMARYRKMAETLKSLEHLIWDRVAARGARSRSLMADPLTEAMVDSLQRRLRGPATYEPPPSLAEVCPGEAPELSLRRLGGYGKPMTQEVIQAIEAMLAPGEARPAAQLFAELPTSLRRDVEVLGLIGDAFDRGSDLGAAPTDLYACAGPDGAERAWLAPRVIIKREGK